MTSHTIKLIEKTMLTDSVMQLIFTKPNNFTFHAGQFVQFLIPEGEKTHKRAYSIASAPKSKSLVFLAKLWPNGKASELFEHIQPGELSTISSPLGHFTKTEDSNSIFIATGTGITPILSMITDDLCNKKTTKEIRLLLGFRSESDMFSQQELYALSDKHKNFSVDITLSQPKAAQWAGLKGRVTAHISKYIATNTQYFLCGSPAMVTEVKNMLLEKDILPSHIHFEMY
ncbi:MAG: hypothetical protein CL685_01740 [Candidatus Magasanikbacteria bacterium]|nr:hypothetical protein [Candidatus Magasanikbacteria bacterium]|tara:strand:+ start:872 stop:1558 length:687 start_codon:yes stop_codon:yes gene_type:complete